MLDLTFGEQVKIVLSRKGMTIKELAETIEERTGKKMSRQNLTQRLGRDNFQEQDMRMIAEILECPFHLSILDDDEAESAAQEVLQEAEDIAEMKREEVKPHPEGPVQRFIVAGANHHEELIYNSPVRDVTIGELADFGEAMKEQEEVAEQKEAEEMEKENFTEESAEQMECEEIQQTVSEEDAKEESSEETEEAADAAVPEEMTEETEETAEMAETDYQMSDEESYAKKKAVTNVFKEYIKKPLLRGYNKAHTEAEMEEEPITDTDADVQKEETTSPQEAAEERRPEPVSKEVQGEINPYTGREYETNSVRMHPKRIGYVQVYDRADHKWTDMTEWAFLGYQERKKAMLGKDYEPPIYLD